MAGHGVGVLLVAAAAGYWVLERSATQKKGLRGVGQWLGATIIIVSLVGAACHILSAAGCPLKSSKSGWCPYPSKASSMMSPDQYGTP